MCDPVTALTIGATALSAAGSVSAGIQAKQQGRYESQVAEINAQQAAQARREAIDQGVVNQVRADRQNAQIQGEQRVALAGSGVEANYGTGADLQSDTALIGSENRQDIALETQRTAQGYAIQGWNDNAQGQAALARGNGAFANGLFGAGSTILGGAAQVVKYRKLASYGSGSKNAYGMPSSDNIY